MIILIAIRRKCIRYVNNGLTFTTTDSQTATLTSTVTGCDSLATLNLTVDPTLTSTTDITICDTELPYTWNGLTFTTTESQTATLTSAVTGCDSLATLNLTVDPTLTSTTDITICDTELPYTWNGLTFTATDSQTATLTSAVTGCDSLATLNLTVDPTLTSTTDITICDTELPYTWNGLTFTTTQSQTATLTSAVTGCDSLATLNLTVDPTLTSTTDITICDTELPYTWNGLTFTTTESQTATLTSSVTGCDSLATLNLNVNNTLLSTTDTTVCDTELPFVWNGLTFTTAGSQASSLVSPLSGCDSLATLNLTVDPTLTSTTDITICDTELPYTWNGLTFTTTESQTATLTSTVTGCDSLATLNLTVDPTLTSTTDITICDTELPYTWNGLTFTATDSQTATLTSTVTGCDSLATLNLTVDPTLTSTTDITICDTELPYTWNGLTFTATDSQTATLTSAVTGCDSLATLNLIVDPTLTSTTDITICDTELPFVWNGLTFTTTQSQTATLTSAVTGCDSLTTLNLTVDPTLTSTTDITICDTELPYTWNGLTFTTTESQTATLTSAVTGCDSLATLNLTVDPTLTSTTDITICDTELPYTWNGLTFTATESQTAALTSTVTGCDSLATLNLTVDPTLTSTTDITICDTELPYTWNGLTFTTTETQTATLTSAVTGCDSLATLNLTVNPTLTSTTDITICDTELPYTWNGLTFTTTETQTATLTSAVTGCDSLATLNLTVDPTLTSTTDITICDTELPYTWNGLTFTTTESQTATLTSAVTGCDSLATLNLTVDPTLTSTTDITICDTELPYTWNGLTFTITQSQTATLTSAVTGCDSLATLNLTVDPTLTSTTDITICDTELPYTWNGLTLTTTQSQTATLTSTVTGCDSLATLNLTVDPTLTSTTDITICDTELPYTWNGLTFTTTQSQTATLTSAVTGCDSLATLNLTVNPTPDLFYVLGASAICSGATTDIELSSSFSGTIYSWDYSQTLADGATTGNGSQINQTLVTTTTNPGSVSYIVTPILNFCIGTPVVISINLNPIPSVDVTPASQTIYAGQTATLNATGSPAGGTYLWSPDGQTTPSITVSPSVTTSYDVTYTLNGCSQDTTGIVNVDVAPEISVNSGVICSGDSILLVASSTIVGGSFLWSTGETAQSIWVSPTSNMVYTVEYTINGFTTQPVISTITVNQTPIVIVSNESICTGQTATLGATGNPLGGSYFWTPTNETAQVINVSPSASTVYSVEYNLNGCIAEAFAEVTVNPIPDLTVNDETMCIGETVVLNAIPNLLGGTYLWGNSSNESSISVTPSSTTSYSILYTLNGCQATATGTVTVNPIPNVSVSDDEICQGETGQLVATPDIPGGVYNWNGNIGGNVFTDSPITDSEYNVVYSVNSCQSLEATGSIFVNEVPLVSVSDTTVCLGDDFILNTTVSIPGGNYVWSPTGETSSAIQLNASQTTIFTVDYSLNNCYATASATVTVNSPPELAIEVSDTLGCAPFTVTLNNPYAGSDTECIWSFNDGLAVGGCNPTYTFTNPGCYDVTLLSSEGGCSSETTLNSLFCAEAPPIASFYANPPIITDPSQWIQFSNNSYGATNYEWDFGDGGTDDVVNPQHLYSEITDGFVITLIAASDLGCLDTTQVSILYQEEPIVYIPNTFTPDGDQYNHVFVPVFTSGYDPFNYEMLIFNRWGEIVFQSYDANVGWDGTYGVNGKQAQDGAYTYKIIYKVLKTDERRLLVGHVNLIR